MKRFRTLLVLSLLAGTSAQAQPADPLDASVSFGYVGTSGNTETTTVNLEMLATYRQSRWEHNAKFQALGSQENQHTKAERYYLEDKSDFTIGDDRYLYVKGSYTDDRFSGFNYQAALSTGYGQYLVKNDKFSFQGFGGVGYRQNAVIDGGNDGEVIFSLGENVAWDISENAALTQSYTSEIGQDLTVSRFEIGLQTNIIDRISTKVSFQARNTSKVPDGKANTDTQTSISLVYTF